MSSFHLQAAMLILLAQCMRTGTKHRSATGRVRLALAGSGGQWLCCMAVGGKAGWLIPNRTPKHSWWSVGSLMWHGCVGGASLRQLVRLGLRGFQLLWGGAAKLHPMFCSLFPAGLTGDCMASQLAYLEKPKARTCIAFYLCHASFGIGMTPHSIRMKSLASGILNFCSANGYSAVQFFQRSPGLVVQDVWWYRTVFVFRLVLVWEGRLCDFGLALVPKDAVFL